MSSSFSVDHNDKLKYKLTSVPIFEQSPSWNNSTKTNAFTIHSQNQSVLFTGNLSLIRGVPLVAKSIATNNPSHYFGPGSPPPNYIEFYNANPNAYLPKSGFIVNPTYYPIGTYIIQTYIEIQDPGGNYQIEVLTTSNPPLSIGNVSYKLLTIVQTNDLDNYLNNGLELLEIKIRFNLHGSTNYIYQNIKFSLDTISNSRLDVVDNFLIDLNSHFFLPINFVQTFTETGLYDVNIYINGTTFITDSNDFLNLNATLYDLIIAPEEDNFEL